MEINDEEIDYLRRLNATLHLKFDEDVGLINVALTLPNAKGEDVEYRLYDIFMLKSLKRLYFELLKQKVMLGTATREEVLKYAELYPEDEEEPYYGDAPQQAADADFAYGHNSPNPYSEGV